MMTLEAPHTIGDVCAIKLERSGVYVPFQVLAEYSEGQIIVVFNYFSSEIPSIDDLESVGPLIIDHHAWPGIPMYVSVKQWDFTYDYIGHCPPLLEVDEPNTQGWTLSDTLPIELQYQWNQLDEELRNAYEPRGVHRLIIPEGVGQEFYDSIDANSPSLTYVTAPVLTPELLELLKRRPLISQLEVSSVGNPEVIDLSQSSITDATINLTGVKRIVLNGRMDSLSFTGDDSQLENISCPHDGRFIHLALDIVFPSARVSGLSQVRSMHITSAAGRRIDMPTICRALPQLEKLVINGNGAMIDGIEHLATYQHLKSLWMSDCFGFDTLVPRKDLPLLDELVLWSVPTAAGEFARQEYSDCANLILKQLRKDDWIRAHAGNPFAAWIGREDMPAPLTKKAIASYTRCYQSLSKRTSKSHDGSQCLRTFMEAWKVIDRKTPLDTADRALIYRALHELTALTELPESFADDLYAEVF